MLTSVRPTLRLLALILILGGCASKPLPPPEWGFEKEAISLHLVASPQLNLDEGTPHTLLVCVYQLKDPNGFNQLAGDVHGIYKLLECGLFDASVAASKRLIINPGQDLDLTLDRAAEAKHVAIVAGYYELVSDRIIRKFDIPVKVEEKGLIKRVKTARPGQLKIEVELGPQQIQRVEGN
jgi:type VI secretion system VasD/TssJ family lipoprotein